MSFFTDSDIAELRAIHDSALFDTCIVQTRTDPGGDYGYGQATYSDSAAVDCLFSPVTVEEAGDQVLQIDAKVLLHRSVSISNLSRIKVTHLHGDAIVPVQVYEIVGGPLVDHTGKLIKLRKVTDGSD